MLKPPPALASFGSELNTAVIGATGGIGRACVDHLAACPAISRLFMLSRSRPPGDHAQADWLSLDLESEETIAEAVAAIKRSAGDLHLVIVASGILHDGDRLRPEKSWRALDASAMETAFRLNAIGPAVIAKHVLPRYPPASAASRTTGSAAGMPTAPRRRPSTC